MENDKVRIHDKNFKIFITRDEIKARVNEMGWEVTKKYKDLKPVFVPILNGSFMFAADFVRACHFDSDMMFVKVKSYEGMSSTGNIKWELGFSGHIKGRHIIIVEDIIDSGNTLKNFIEEIKEEEPASVAIVSLLLKPDAIKHDIPMDYIGFRIPNAFVVGYGLDYDDFGRTLPDIYQLDED